MKIDARAYNKKTETHGRKVGVMTLCGSLTFKADSEFDELLVWLLCAFS